MAISEEDLRGLSAAERESLLSVEDGDEDVIHELRTGGEAPSPSPSPSPAPDPAPDPDPAPVDTTKSPAPPASAPPASAPAPDPAANDDPESIQQVQIPRATPTDAAAQRTNLRAEQSASLQKLMDGEISQEDYNKANSEVQDKLDALVRAEAIDQARDSVSRDTMMQDYSKELNSVQKEVRVAGLDLAANDGALGKDFDRAVKMFAQEAMDRGLTDKPGDLAASKAALQDARDLILRRHGKLAPAAQAPAVAPAPMQAPAPAPRQPAPADRSKFPPTLANVPAAADATIASEFAHLEGLDVPALERALAKMTPEQQDRYLG